MKNKKLILFEGEMIRPRGHHYDQLIENTLRYNKNAEIIWLLNKDFDLDNKYIPKKTKIFKEIISSDRKVNDIVSFMKVTKNILSNIVIIFYLLFKFKKKNYFIIKKIFFLPRYLPSFLKAIDKLNVKDSDLIIFQTARINDFDLGSDLNELFPKLKLFFRVMQLNKKKKFLKFCNILRKKKLASQLNRNFFIFVENKHQQIEIKKNTGINVKIFYNNLTFFEKRKISKKFTIGFVGETRIEKGFDKIPKLIMNINKLNINKKIDYIIQINNYPKNLITTIKKLEKLRQEFGNIKLIYGYIDFYKYRKILSKIDILPILHRENQLKFNGSGIVFSSIVNQIPIVISNKSKYVKNIFHYNSYLEAKNDEDYSNQIKKIILNYNFFKKNCIKQQKVFKTQLMNDPINIQVNKWSKIL